MKKKNISADGGPRYTCGVVFSSNSLPLHSELVGSLLKGYNQENNLQFNGNEPSEMESQMMVFNPRQTQIKIPKFSSPSDEGHNKMVEISRCLNLEDLTFMKLITDPNYFSKFVHPAQIHQNY